MRNRPNSRPGSPLHHQFAMQWAARITRVLVWFVVAAYFWLPQELYRRSTRRVVPPGPEWMPGADCPAAVVGMRHVRPLTFSMLRRALACCEPNDSVDPTPTPVSRYASTSSTWRTRQNQLAYEKRQREPLPVCAQDDSLLLGAAAVVADGDSRAPAAAELVLAIASSSLLPYYRATHEAVQRSIGAIAAAHCENSSSLLWAISRSMCAQHRDFGLQELTNLGVQRCCGAHPSLCLDNTAVLRQLVHAARSCYSLVDREKPTNKRDFAIVTLSTIYAGRPELSSAFHAIAETLGYNEDLASIAVASPKWCVTPAAVALVGASVKSFGCNGGIRSEEGDLAALRTMTAACAAFPDALVDALALAARSCFPRVVRFAVDALPSPPLLPHAPRAALNALTEAAACEPHRATSSSSSTLFDLDYATTTDYEMSARGCGGDPKYTMRALLRVWMDLNSSSNGGGGGDSEIGNALGAAIYPAPVDGGEEDGGGPSSTVTEVVEDADADDATESSTSWEDVVPLYFPRIASGSSHEASLAALSALVSSSMAHARKHHHLRSIAVGGRTHTAALSALEVLVANWGEEGEYPALVRGFARSCGAAVVVATEHPPSAPEAAAAATASPLPSQVGVAARLASLPNAALAADPATHALLRALAKRAVEDSPHMREKQARDARMRGGPPAATAAVVSSASAQSDAAEGRPTTTATVCSPATLTALLQQWADLRDDIAEDALALSAEADPPIASAGYYHSAPGPVFSLEALEVLLRARRKAGDRTVLRALVRTARSGSRAAEHALSLLTQEYARALLTQGHAQAAGPAAADGDAAAVVVNALRAIGMGRRGGSVMSGAWTDSGHVVASRQHIAARAAVDALACAAPPTNTSPPVDAVIAARAATAALGDIALYGETAPAAAVAALHFLDRASAVEARAFVTRAINPPPGGSNGNGTAATATAACTVMRAIASGPWAEEGAATASGTHGAAEENGEGDAGTAGSSRRDGRGLLTPQFAFSTLASAARLDGPLSAAAVRSLVGGCWPANLSEPLFHVFAQLVSSAQSSAACAAVDGLLTLFGGDARTLAAVSRRILRDGAPANNTEQPLAEYAGYGRGATALLLAPSCGWHVGCTFVFPGGSQQYTNIGMYALARLTWDWNETRSDKADVLALVDALQSRLPPAPDRDDYAGPYYKLSYTEQRAHNTQWAIAAANSRIHLVSDDPAAGAEEAYNRYGNRGPPGVGGSTHGFPRPVSSHGWPRDDYECSSGGGASAAAAAAAEVAAWNTSGDSADAPLQPLSTSTSASGGGAMERVTPPVPTSTLFASRAFLCPVRGDEEQHEATSSVYYTAAQQVSEGGSTSSRRRSRKAVPPACACPVA